MRDPDSNATEQSPLLEQPAEPVAGDDLDVGSVDHAEISVSKQQASFILVSLAVLIFLQSTNFSVLTTTQSTIADDLDSFAEVSWFTSAYLIAMSSVSPLAGRLSQIFSPRYCIFIASLLFAIGSVVTSQASVLSVFLLGRVITGLGAAGVLTLCLILCIQIAPEERRGLLFGAINTAVTTGVSLGAIIGGALLESLGWRSVFWLQAPLALVSGLGVFLSLPKAIDTYNFKSEDRSLSQKLLGIDYAGAVLLTSTIVSLLFGLSSPKILYIPIGVAGALLVLFILNEAFVAKDPIIPINLLKSRGALMSCFSQVGIMMARWLVLFYTPVYALAVRGWSPTTAGSILVPTNAGFASGGLAVGLLHVKRSGSFYLPALISCIFFPITLGVLAELVTEDSSVYAVIAATFANGFAAGAILNYTLAHLLHVTQAKDHAVASSLLGTFRGFSGSFGSAIGGGIFSRILKANLENGFRDEGLEHKGDLVRRLIGQPALVRMLDGVEKEIARQSYVDAIRGLLAAGVGLTILMIFVQACTGWRGVEKSEDVVSDEVEDS